MRNTRDALVRWSAILGLCLIAGVTIPLAWVTHKVSGGSLTAAEWAKRELKALLAEPAPPLDPYIQRALDRAEGR